MARVGPFLDTYSDRFDQIKCKNLHTTFVYLEKALDHVLRNKMWPATRVVSIPEWALNLVQAMQKRVRLELIINRVACFM